MSYYGEWKPYVPVAQRRAKAQRKMAALRKKGVDIQPIKIDGRKIATTFWGDAWCQHLESFSDFSNRLPRGRTYVRNGSVCHLVMKKGHIEAKVVGTEIYEVRVTIKTLSKQHWNQIKAKCSGQIGTLLELLQGNLSDNIMTVVTDRTTGLFPKPAEIQFTCDCPDYAYMCKHVAATLYGVGARLDDDPSLLFRLRGVNHDELIEAQVAAPAGTGKGKSKRLASENLGDVFGIELDTESESLAPKKKSPVRSTKKVAIKKRATSRKGRTTKKKTATRKKVKTKVVATKKPPKTTVKKKAKATVRKKAAKKSRVRKTAATTTIEGN